MYVAHVEGLSSLPHKHPYRATVKVLAFQHLASPTVSNQKESKMEAMMSFLTWKSCIWKEKLGICKCRSSDRGSLNDTETRVTGSGQRILDIVGYVKSCQQRLYVKKNELEGKQKMIKNRISRSEDSQ